FPSYKGFPNYKLEFSHAVQHSVCNTAQFARQYKTTLLHKNEKELNYGRTEEFPQLPRTLRKQARKREGFPAVTYKQRVSPQYNSNTR
ncbi:hypothetical protein L9F63_001855, partial [Diploptera punctata]